MKLFSKLKDYNNLLEEILDKKTFSSMSKNLLLSMLYKLEASYEDYEIVKVDAISKDDFLRNILDIIKLYCVNIKTVQPNSEQADVLVKNGVEAVTNSKERSILLYPTERAMLYAICDIEQKYFFLKKDFVFKDILQRILVDGYKQNTMEVLKNFSGWSWDVNPNEKSNYIANIIYQNLMMIKNEKFLCEWRKDDFAKRDYLASIVNSVKKVCGNDNYYIFLCRVLYAIASDKKRQEIKEKFDNPKILENIKSEHDELIKLQKEFLKYMNEKIKKADFNEDIIDLLYEMRYYQNLILSEGVLIKDYKGLKIALDNTLKLLITKACKMGVLKIISMNIETNFKLLKYILNTRIIDLEEIKVYLEIENNNILVKVYDKEVFEKEGKEKLVGDKKDIVIKKKKLVKIFN